MERRGERLDRITLKVRYDDAQKLGALLCQLGTLVLEGQLHLQGADGEVGTEEVIEVFERIVDALGRGLNRVA